MKKIIIVVTVCAALIIGAFCLIPKNETASGPIISVTEPTHVDTLIENDVTIPEQPEKITLEEVIKEPWDIVNNEGVNQVEVLPGLPIMCLQEWSNTTTFTEIKLHQTTRWDSIKFGTVGDSAVAEFVMDTDENLVWNVRMEKSDALENKTGIDIPEKHNFNEWTEDDISASAQSYIWSNEDGTWSEMYILYFEETQNLYTFYSNQLVYELSGDWPSPETFISCNNGRMPYAVLLNIDISYGQPDYNEIQAARSSAQKTIYYFRMVMGDNYVDYQYEFGMTMKEWVNSKYNTDGWKINPNDSTSIMSNDGEWIASAEGYIWNSHLAV